MISTASTLNSVFLSLSFHFLFNFLFRVHLLYMVCLRWLANCHPLMTFIKWIFQCFKCADIERAWAFGKKGLGWDSGCGDQPHCSFGVAFPQEGAHASSAPPSELWNAGQRKAMRKTEASSAPLHTPIHVPHSGGLSLEILSLSPTRSCRTQECQPHISQRTRVALGNGHGPQLEADLEQLAEQGPLPQDKGKQVTIDTAKAEEKQTCLQEERGRRGADLLRCQSGLSWHCLASGWATFVTWGVLWVAHVPPPCCGKGVSHIDSEIGNTWLLAGYCYFSSWWSSLRSHQICFSWPLHQKGSLWDVFL